MAWVRCSTEEKLIFEHRLGTTDTKMLVECNGKLIDQYNFEASCKDDTGLGRWVVMVFRGSEGIDTRIIYGYNPCVTSPKAKRYTCQQHRRYLIEKGNTSLALSNNFTMI